MAGIFFPQVTLKSIAQRLNFRGKYAILGQSHMANHPNMIKHGLRRNSALEIVRISPDNSSLFP